MSAKWSLGMESAVRAAVAGKPVRDAAMEYNQVEAEVAKRVLAARRRMLTRVRK